MTDEIVGIDLGTTNSEIALYRAGKPEILADAQGRKILPSVVGLSETGEILVGEEARNQWLLYPDRTIRSIKRRMGRDETVRLGEHQYTPQEISAIILKRLKETAETRLGHTVHKAVITVPEYPNRTFPATVEASSQSVDVSSGTTRMQLGLDNSKGELMPGDYANVKLGLQRDGSEAAPAGADGEPAKVPIHAPPARLLEAAARHRPWQSRRRGRAGGRCSSRARPSGRPR